jgi:hypothetical protein
MGAIKIEAIARIIPNFLPTLTISISEAFSFM